MARKHGTTGSKRIDGASRTLKRGPGGGRSDTKVARRLQAAAVGAALGQPGGKVKLPRKFQTTK